MNSRSNLYLAILMSMLIRIRITQYNNQAKYKQVKSWLMGNQQGKPAQGNADNLNKDVNTKQNGQNQLNQYVNGEIPNIGGDQPNLRNSAVNNLKNRSRDPSALDSFRNKNKQISNRNSPNLMANQQPINTSSNNKVGPRQSTLNKNPLTNQHDKEDQNQFMPLMKLAPVGQVRLRITLLTLNMQKNPKFHLKKNSSVNNSILKWTKDSRNIFTFVLKEDQNHELVIEVDLQGNTLNNKDQYWSALCPINIPFGQTVKVGQMTCVNWYCRLDQQDFEDQGQESLGPSLKNIDFKISEQTFGKWGEKVPKNFYDQNKNEVIKKVYQKNEPQKFIPYKELSRYFDSKNSWRATTFIQETPKYFRGWVIEVTDHNSVISISSQLHSDLKNREAFYAKIMFEKQFGVESESI